MDLKDPKWIKKDFIILDNKDTAKHVTVINKVNISKEYSTTSHTQAHSKPGIRENHEMY